MTNCFRLNYVSGLNCDEGIKTLDFSVFDAGINLYIDKFKEMIEIDYSRILDLELYSNKSYKNTPLKASFWAVLGTAICGMWGGIVAGLLNFREAKKVYSMIMTIGLDENQFAELEVSGEKQDLDKLYLWILSNL